MRADKSPDDIESALQDILSMRQSIQAFQISKEGKITQSVYKAQLALQGIALALASIMLVVELVGSNLITAHLLKPLPIAYANFYIALSIAVFLVGCVITSYKVVGRAAEKTGSDADQFIRRNFSYLQNLSHISDLAVKFFVLSLLLYVGRPDLIAVSLLVFTSDYLLQGRFFVYPPRYAQVLAALTLALAGFMFLNDIPVVLWPLLWFFLLTCFSMAQLRKMKRVED